MESCALEFVTAKYSAMLGRLGKNISDAKSVMIEELTIVKSVKCLFKIRSIIYFPRFIGENSIFQSMIPLFSFFSQIPETRTCLLLFITLKQKASSDPHLFGPSTVMARMHPLPLLSYLFK